MSDTTQPDAEGDFAHPIPRIESDLAMLAAIQIESVLTMLEREWHHKDHFLDVLNMGIQRIRDLNEAIISALGEGEMREGAMRAIVHGPNGKMSLPGTY